MNPTQKWISGTARACNRVGKNVPHWVQGAGGNVSYKRDGMLYVKASGVRLISVTPEKGIARVRLPEVLQALETCGSEEEYSALLTSCSEPGSERPSMETGFHALLPKTWVFHFHSIAALLMSYERNRNPKTFARWFSEHAPAPAKWLGPLLPGLRLSQEIGKAKDADLIFLENHGIVLQANDAGILDRWTSLEDKFLKDFSYERAHAPVDWTKLPSVPFKRYLPDSAVFQSAMLALIGPDGKLVKNARERDLAATELWAFTARLLEVQKNFPELPMELFNQIGTLPTEKFRQLKKA